MAKRNAQERFWEKVAQGDGCWVWTASCTAAGYGQFHLEGKNKLAHRLAYGWIVGPIPEGLDIDHICRNRACVNPAHLEPVTRSENNRRGLLGKLRPERATCPHGHPYDEENTYVDTRGFKVCRMCSRARCREWMRAKRARM